METSHPSRTFRSIRIPIAAATAAAIAVTWPERTLATLAFVADSFVAVAPIVLVGLVLSAWVAASGAGAVASRTLGGHPAVAILVASGIGAVTPVCGVTVLPLMTGLLAAGVPLAPIMAFWVSSPVTDPGLFAATWATLGPAYAVGKTAAAFALGLVAGLATVALAGSAAVRRPLRSRSWVGGGTEPACGPPAGFCLAIWREEARRRQFRRELFSMTRLVVVCLSLAFAAEHLLRAYLPPDLLGDYVGAGTDWAIPLAVTVGAPLYLDGYAALPLVRGLLELGMAPGAAMGFLVAGSAASVWGAMAVALVLRPGTLVLYLAVAVLGSLISAYAFAWILPLL